MDNLKKLISEKQIFLIKGPRQVGKTTIFHLLVDWLIKQGISKNNIFLFTFEDPETVDQFNLNPKEFVLRRIENLDKKAYFFFDEYHWVKQGGKKLKLLYDLYGDKVKFLVTGSSSLELTFETSKYLVGRAFSFYLYHFSFREFLQTKKSAYVSAYLAMQEKLKLGKLPPKTIFDLKIKQAFEEFIVWGGYPEVIKAKDNQTKILVLENLVGQYLEKDIRALLLIRNLEGYRRLLKILAGQIGQLVNYTRYSSDTGLGLELLKKYFDILEETYVVQRVRPFYKNVSSELRKSPKHYFFDLGLRNTLLKSFNLEGLELEQAVENYVFSSLKKSGEDFHFWRTKAGAEIDFIVIKGSGELLPVEVKFRQLKRPKLSQGFFSFIEAYQPQSAVVLTNDFWGERKVKNTKVIFYPVWYF